MANYNCGKNIIAAKLLWNLDLSSSLIRLNSRMTWKLWTKTSAAWSVRLQLHACSRVFLSLQRSPFHPVLLPADSFRNTQKLQPTQQLTCACSFQISSCSWPITSIGGGIWAAKIPTWLSESSGDALPRFLAAAERSRFDFSRSSRVTWKTFWHVKVYNSLLTTHLQLV